MTHTGSPATCPVCAPLRAAEQKLRGHATATGTLAQRAWQNASRRIGMAEREHWMTPTTPTA